MSNVDIESIGGVYWHDAPLPPRQHECWAQTKGWIVFDQVQRCACGAIRNPRFGGVWLDKNQRREWGEGESIETELRIAGDDWMFNQYIALKRFRTVLWEHFPFCRFARWAVPKLNDWLTR